MGKGMEGKGMERKEWREWSGVERRDNTSHRPSAY
jgi:hypothetical protein